MPDWTMKRTYDEMLSETFCVQPPLLLFVEYLVEGIVGEQEAQSGAAAICRHTGLANPLLLVVRPAEAHFLPVGLVGSAVHLLLHLGAQAYHLQGTLLLLRELQHALARPMSQHELAVAIPGPGDALARPGIKVCGLAISGHSIQLASPLDRDSDRMRPLGNGSIPRRTLGAMPHWKELRHQLSVCRCASAASRGRLVHRRQIPPP